MPRPYNQPEKRPCPHCGRGLSPGNLVNHAPRCLENPTIANPLRAFMRAYATDGVAMADRDYRRRSSGAGMPSSAHIREYFGTWAAFAEWCGLTAIKRVRDDDEKLTVRRAAINAPAPPRISGVREDAMEGLPVYPALRCVRAWHPKAHCYIPIGWEKVLAVR